MKRLLTVIVVCCLAVVGCSRSVEEPAVEQPEAQPAAWVPVAPEAMSETQKAQQELVLAATNALAAEMMGELMAAMDSGGPEGAIAVCQTTAPTVAAHISEQYGLKIGRTSHRLRNPANAPPEWAVAHVSDLVADPTFLKGPNGEMGALLPIRLKAECQMCHGPAEMIDDEVQSAISETYPEDRATGFGEGDLRGWFWVETPPGESDTIA
jgi:hypothetical protein